MELNILKTDGTQSGEKIKLSDEIFGIEPNEHAMYMAVRTYLGNKRQGNAKVKTRGEVRGGGKKPFKQKHTGMARQGSKRSPLMPGGGSIFGPKPRDYSSQLPKKMHRLARKSALSLRAKEGGVMVVEDFSFDEPKTKQMAQVLQALKLGSVKTLLLTPATNQNVAKAGRNIPVLNVIEANKASTYDFVNSKILLIQKSALEVLQNTFKN
jgi:large subunit ribosomal protein L4